MIRNVVLVKLKPGVDPVEVAATQQDFLDRSYGASEEESRA